MWKSLLSPFSTKATVPCSAPASASVQPPGFWRECRQAGGFGLCVQRDFWLHQRTGPLTHQMPLFSRVPGSVQGFAHSLGLSSDETMRPFHGRDS